MLGAFFAGVGGSLYGHYLGSFSPASFYMAYTFTLISMLVIGGMQSLTGAVVGVVIVTLLSEVLRNLERGVPARCDHRAAALWCGQIMLGVIFILIMIFRPSGIMGDRELTLGLLCRVRSNGRGVCHEYHEMGSSGAGPGDRSLCGRPAPRRRTRSRSARRSTSPARFRRSTHRR